MTEFCFQIATCLFYGAAPVLDMLKHLLPFGDSQHTRCHSVRLPHSLCTHQISDGVPGTTVAVARPRNSMYGSGE